MRDVKFRAWLIEDKKMLEVYVIDRLNDIVDLEYGNIEIPTEDVVLMQYTQLKDVSGKEIYEGDILMFRDNRAEIAEVKIGRFGGLKDDIEEEVGGSIYGVYFKPFATTKKTMKKPYCLEMQLNNYIIRTENVRVIGNIYENKEIIEEWQCR